MDHLRGFSFMAEAKVEVGDLQYIEGGELERQWKTSRRQRLKEQEQKIWEEFVKEQDAVKAMCNDDPYQFLHQVPEACLQEMLEGELLRVKKEVEQETHPQEQPIQGEGDFHQIEDIQHSVTFVGEGEGQGVDSDIFHIYVDEKDEPSGPSGPEDEVFNESSVGSPSTVRERDSENSSLPLIESEVKSSENVSKMIESSIYCAKVKDLRLKIYDEIQSLMCSLERQDVMKMEREEVSRTCRRSAEFCSRFGRIYMYQLQRQIQDIKRNTLHTLPFAKHTHFHAQMVRVASLHQNLLQAFQVFHKSLEQTACVRESAAMLHALALTAREATAYSAAVPAPADHGAAKLIYDDEMLASCDKLDEAVCEHSLRVSDLLSTADNTSNSNGRRKKGVQGSLSKSTKSISEKRFSMYSFDMLRPNINAKSSSSKDNQSSTSKVGVASCIGGKTQKQSEPEHKSPKKSPRSKRLPLMRGATARRPRARLPKDTEIATMVETVETVCTSSRMSREVSPPETARSEERSPRTHSDAPWTARTHSVHSPKKAPPSSPRRRSRLCPLSPAAAKHRATSPTKSQIMKALSNIRRDAQDCGSSRDIQCAKKDDDHGKNFDKNLAKNPGKVDINLDKADYSDKATYDMESTKDSSNVGNFDSTEYDSGKNIDSVKERGKGNKKAKESVVNSPSQKDGSRSDRERRQSSRADPVSCEVTELLRQLCSGDVSGSNKSDRGSRAKNAQLFCVSSGSPRLSNTPQLLRILEKTIQKKAPKPMYQKPADKNPERFQMKFNIPDKAAENLLQYRTKFVQHMLASSMYANSAVGKPWEIIGSISEKLIDEILTGCAQEMQLRGVVHELYNCETK